MALFAILKELVAVWELEGEFWDEPVEGGDEEGGELELEHVTECCEGFASELGFVGGDLLRTPWERRYYIKVPLTYIDLRSRPLHKRLKLHRAKYTLLRQIYITQLRMPKLIPKWSKLTDIVKSLIDLILN